MLAISYKSSLLGIFDRVTVIINLLTGILQGKAKSVIKLEHESPSLTTSQINKIAIHQNMPLGITANENRTIKFIDLNSSNVIIREK